MIPLREYDTSYKGIPIASRKTYFVYLVRQGNSMKSLSHDRDTGR
jgi:hypothetical protein